MLLYHYLQLILFLDTEIPLPFYILDHQFVTFFLLLSLNVSNAALKSMHHKASPCPNPIDVSNGPISYSEFWLYISHVWVNLTSLFNFCVS
jgi:hypothetical protein